MGEPEVIGYVVVQWYDEFDRWQQSGRSDTPPLTTAEAAEELDYVRENYPDESFRLAALSLLPEAAHAE